MEIGAGNPEAVDVRWYDGQDEKAAVEQAVHAGAA
jgi:hypothetical protein